MRNVLGCAAADAGSAETDSLGLAAAPLLCPMHSAWITCSCDRSEHRTFKKQDRHIDKSSHAYYNKIRFFSAEMNRLLFENGCSIIESRRNHTDLEQYYLKLTGGSAECI